MKPTDAPRSMLAASAIGQEIRAVARLSLPVVVVQLGLMLMGTVDIMMLGRVSPAALAAGALGNVWSSSLLIGAMGILMAIDPLVAQAHGAGDARAIGAHLERAVVLGAVLTVPLSLLMWSSRGMLLALGQGPELAGSAALYLRCVLLGNLPFLLFVVLRQTVQAIGVVRPAVVAVVVGNVVNLVADYVLIFGHFGAPRLGVAGAACATALGRWVLFAALALAARPALAPYWRGRLSAHALAWREHWRALAIGVPIGLHMSLELGVFTAVSLLMGRLGTRELAGHQIALSLAALSYMVPTGIAAAAATRVGNAIGRRDMPGARRSAAVALGLGAGTMSFFALLYGFFPRALASLFSGDPGVIAMGVVLIPIAALFQVFDGTQVVASGVLRGAADTRVPAAVALAAYWAVGLPLGLLLSGRTRLGPSGLWWGLTIGIATLAFLLLGRIVHRFRGEIARVDSAMADRIGPASVVLTDSPE